MTKLYGKRDQAWNRFFAAEDVVGTVQCNGSYQTSATRLKEIAGYEPRLLTKWDCRAHVPQVFVDNQLSILSVSSSQYMIAPFEIFHDLEQDKCRIAKVETRSMPRWMESIGPDLVRRSENALLSACHAAGVFQDILGADVLPSVYGRLRTGAMSFNVRSLQGGKEIPVHAENVQFEIDASYESPTGILLVEAKNHFIPNFNIRQLYFPWLFLKNCTAKPVYPLFAMFSDGILSLFRYRFDDPENFNSMQMESVSRLSFFDRTLTLRDIRNALEAVEFTKSAGMIGDIPFPQADTFECVLDVCDFLNGNPSDYNAIAEHLDYDPRQGHYYAEAARFLDLVIRDGNGTYRLSAKGKQVFSLSYNSRTLEIIKQIVEIEVFKKAFAWYFEKDTLPSRVMVADWILKAGWCLSESTRLRRAVTVQKWIEWVIGSATAH